MAQRNLLKPFGAPQPPQKKFSAAEGGKFHRPVWGSLGTPNFLFSFFTAIEGTAPPEGERNPAEGGCFASVINQYTD